MIKNRKFKSVALTFFLISIVSPFFSNIYLNSSEKECISLPFSQNSNILLTTKDASNSNKSLLFIHSYMADSGIWTGNGWNNSELYEDNISHICYYNNVRAINYYWNGREIIPPNYIGNNTPITSNNDINFIADKLYDYIINPENNIFEEIDFLCHSMGGIVVRALVCRHYEDLVKNGYLIDDIMMLGTPNQGSMLAALIKGTHPFEWNLLTKMFDSFEEALGFLVAINFLLTTQARQFSYNGPFIKSLKVQDSNGIFDETPYGKNDDAVWPIENGVPENHNDIDWTTIAGEFPIVGLEYLMGHITDAFTLLLFWMDLATDGLVAVRSVALNGASNIIWSFESHISLLSPASSSKKSLIINILTEKN